MILTRAGLWFLLTALAWPAFAQDYEREKRWSDEIVPGLVVGDAVWLDAPGGRRFLGLLTEADKAKPAVLLVHGLGVHPDHGVIGALRASLADAGFTTLSVQMPVLHAEATPKDYQAVFPDAASRIKAAAAWLAAKHGGRVVLLSHSMGSSMSHAYYELAVDAPFAAWVCMGLSGAFGSMRNVKVPVMDVFGEKDLPGVLRGEWRRRMTVDSIPGSRQLKVAHADHFFAGREKDLAAAVVAFLSGR